MTSRANFVNQVRDLVFKQVGFIDMRRIATIGRDEAVLSPQEISTVEHRNQLPDWLIEELGLMSRVLPGSTANHRVISQGSVYRLDPPQQWSSDLLPAAFELRTGTTPDLAVTSGQNGTFILQNFSQTGLIEGRYIPEITDPKGLWAWEVFKHREPRHLKGSTFVCVTEGSTVFLHWLLDTMPRFEIARLGGFATGDFDNIVLATAQSAFHHEGIEALQLDKAKIRTRDSLGPVIVCDSFCVASMPRRHSLANPLVYEFINRVFRTESARKTGRRIYIPRGATNRRPLYNEPEVEAVLAKFGFDTVHADKLSVGEMARLCSGVSHVVAPHGAGLANLAFVPEGGNVLELYGAHISPDYWKISCQRRHRYACLQGKSETGERFSPEMLHNLGFFDRNALGYRIDISEFQQAVEGLCS